MKRSTIVAMAIPLVIIVVSAVLAAAPEKQRPPIPAATPQELASLVGSGSWVIMEFGGAHCIPCMHMQPVLQDLREAVGKKAVIRNFWIQDHPDVAQLHKIMLMPTQVVFNPKGEEVFRHMGYFPPAEFQAALQKLGIL